MPQSDKYVPFTYCNAFAGRSFFLAFQLFCEMLDQSGSALLTPIPTVINWWNPQAWGSVSVIGLLYREWAALKRIMQFIVPPFAIGDVVRAEITTNNRTKFLYASIRRRWRWHYIVAYHEEERHEQKQHEPESIVPITNTALRSPDQLFTERWALPSMRDHLFCSILSYCRLDNFAVRAGFWTCLLLCLCALNIKVHVFVF